MFNFHSGISSLGVAGLLGSIAGWIVVLLPIIIAVFKQNENILRVLILNLSYILVSEITTWLSFSSIQLGLTPTIVIFVVNIVLLWVSALVFAIIGKRKDDSKLDEPEELEEKL